MVLSNCAWEGCARDVWNQKLYHPAAVNDDLTIPQQQQNKKANGVVVRRNQLPESSFTHSKRYLFQYLKKAQNTTLRDKFSIF